MNTETEYPVPAIPRVSNELPANYRTWLEYYDDIPVELREVSLLRTICSMDRRTFKEKTGKDMGLLIEGQIEYSIDREYMLARLAEELLPLRLTKNEVDQLHRLTFMAGKYESVDCNAALNSIANLWAVARNK